YVADFIGGANRVLGTVLESNNQLSTIETALGRFQAPSVANLTAGSRAVICWRPEQLHQTSDGVIAVTVTHQVYRGAEWLVEAKAHNNTILSFLVRQDSVPEVGAGIRLSFDPKNAWIAADNGAES
ncbi:MAG: TOBE domain-containing protein, partial [Alphaproteobacteria bacterium]